MTNVTPTSGSSVTSSEASGTLPLADLSSVFVRSIRTAGSLEERGRCAKFLYGCLENIRGHEGWRAELQEKNHEFWKALISFICASRSDEDLETMDRSLSACHCDLEDAATRHLHDVPLPENLAETPSPLHALISNSLEILHECLYNVDYIQVCSATIHKPLPLWPMGTSDLLPSGGEIVVTSFLQWARKYKLPAAHAALCRVLMCTRSLVRPYLVKNRNFRRSLLQCFDPINQPTSDSLTVQQKKKMGDFLEDVLECFMTVVDIRGEDGVLEWVGKRAPEFITLCNNALEITFPKSEFARTNFTDGPASAMATMVVQLLHSPTMVFSLMSINLNLHIEVREVMNRGVQGPESEYFLALCKIHAYRVGRQECTALACGRKAETMTETALKFCSGCRCVTYCSEECQMAEWGNPVLPHKKACKAFRVFTPYLDELKEGAIRKTAKKCLRDGMPESEAMNANRLLRMMDEHRDRFSC